MEGGRFMSSNGGIGGTAAASTGGGFQFRNTAEMMIRALDAKCEWVESPVRGMKGERNNLKGYLPLSVGCCLQPPYHQLLSMSYKVSISGQCGGIR